jgi:hypothetical protein
MDCPPLGIRRCGVLGANICSLWHRVLLQYGRWNLDVSGRKNVHSLRVGLTGKALPESIAPRIRDRQGVVAGLRREWYIIKYKS